ncbi:hypothetical protein MCOR27_009485 [Pyricularia oryzae]|uniref:Mid2 domain-containing protein n=2 Tax=Pyricularia TaxID=48558 RepID=A0ABQ8NB99_PYRGI|nr:hypothetical protein MCOR01_011688 [Pyricularia oryzae]KAI6294351.1 hypothetical protein MCOR33_008506 [Pyricularia grisea]KAH9440037.1 hypothetical protein MCOR02_003568 [Pyricularia oryzae]KAI6259643.1 hypothetical protein MCOR19_003998 [Pyricularia oryzae]KAI6269933.1 hypothetical protein MCOR26_008478 [Pyricularia oryzae]
MALLAVLVLALGLFCRLGVQQEIDTTYTQGKNGVFWIFPTEFQTFNTLDVVNVTWRSPFKNPKLFTFCIDNDVVKQQKATNANDAGDGWLLVKLDFTATVSCWFNLRPGDDAQGGANSPRWGLRDTPRPQLTTIGITPTPEPTTGAPSSTSASTLSTTTTTSASPSSTAPSGTTPAGGTAEGASGGATSDGGSGGGSSSSSSDGLSVGAKAGIGIGAAIGAIGLLVVAFFLGRRSSKRGPDAAASPSSQPSELHTNTPSVAPAQPATAYGDGWTPTYEAESKTPVTSTGYYHPQQLPAGYAYQQSSPATVTSELGTVHNAAELAGQLPHDRAAELSHNTSPNRDVENQKFMP